MVFSNNVQPVFSMSVPPPIKVTKITQKSYVEKIEEKHESKRIKWGRPFWNLFHVLAEKIKESEFPKVRVELLNMIYTICSNLPCPDCTNHAVSYMNGINFNTIKSKNDLKLFLFDFHNAVNARKMYPIFHKDNLDSTYQNANVIVVIDNFLKSFKQHHKGLRMIADDIYRDRITKKLITWFKENVKYFD